MAVAVLGGRTMANFNGSNGNDTITGTIGIDTIRGKSGNDLLNGLEGDDKIMGGTGDDDIAGGAGNDLLIGGDQNDTLLGGANDDVIYGDTGGPKKGSTAWGDGFGGADGDDDELEGGSGSDYVFGDGGNDLAIYDVDSNIGVLDYYSGGQGIDALLLRMSSAQWFRIDVQNDIASYLSFVATQTDPVSGEANGQGFDFHAFGLTAREFETLRVVVDGVELTPEGDPVTANDDDAETNEDTPVNITVLGNDSDIDTSDILMVISNTDGANGTVFLENDQSLTYTPDENFFGTDSFTYGISDGNGGSDMATVTANPGNDAPVTTPGSVVANDTSVDASEGDATVVIPGV